MGTVISKLEADCNNLFKEDGGSYAIKGFNFQAFAGIYIIFYLTKNNYTYKITFEKEDDIFIEDYTSGKKYKIQVKSINLTLASIIKKDKFNNTIIEKLINNHHIYDYVSLIVPQEKAKTLIKSCNITDEKFLEGETYILSVNSKEKNKEILDNIFSLYNCTNTKVLLKKMPFLDEAENSFRFLLGFAVDDSGISLEINAGDLYKLLGMIYCISEKKFYFNEFTNETFSKYYNIKKSLNSENELLEALYQDIASIESSLIVNRIKRQQANYYNKKEYFNSLTSGQLPKFKKNMEFKEYYNKCRAIINKSITKKKFLSKLKDMEYTLIWEAIENVIEEELKSDESSI